MSEPIFETLQKFEEWIALGERIANMRNLPESQVKEVRDKIRRVTLANKHLIQEMTP